MSRDSVLRGGSLAATSRSSGLFIMEKNAMTDTNVSFAPFDSDYDDKDKISDGLWVPCRICEQIFMRVRLTARYCNTCGRAFCEGERGSFTGRGPAVCVQCRSLATK